MLDDKIALRGLLRFFWKKVLTTREAAAEICAVEGRNAVSKSMAIKWFKRFSLGDLSLRDKPRSGRPEELENGSLCKSLEEEPHAGTCQLSRTLGCSQSTINRHLRKLDYVLKLQNVPLTLHKNKLEGVLM